MTFETYVNWYYTHLTTRNLLKIKCLVLGLSLWVGASQLVTAQSIEEMIRRAEQAGSPLEKARAFNDVADTLIWQGDAATQDPNIYLDKVFNVCNQEDCQEEWYRAKVLRLQLEVEAGEYGNVFTFALPTLKRHSFRNAVTKAHLHENCGLYYFFQGMLDSVGYHMKSAYDILKEQAPYDKRFRAAHEWLGFYYSFRSIHDTSLIYMHRAAEMHLKENDTLALIKTLKYTSSFYQVMGDQKNALTYLLKAREYVKNYPPAAYFYYSINSGLGNLHLDLKQYDDAIKVFSSSLQQLKDDPKTEPEAKAIRLWDYELGIATAYVRKREPENALQHIQIAQDLCDQYNLPSLQFIGTKLQDAEARTQLGQYEQASNLLEQVLDISEKGGSLEAYNSKIAQILTSIMIEAEYAPSLTLLAKMRPLLDNIVENNKNVYSREGLNAHKLRLLMSMKRGEDELMIADFRRIMELSDTLFNRENTLITNELLTEYKTKEQEQQLQIQELELGKRTWQRNAVIVLVLGLLVIIAGGIFYFWQRQRYTLLLEEQVAVRTKELQQTNKELERFNYIASHDLKEPLRNILSFSGLLRHQVARHQGANTETVTDYFDLLDRNANQMFRLVENVRVFSSIQTPNELEAVDLNQLIRGVNNTLLPIITEKEAVIHFEALPTIITDENKLFLVFRHLIENGVEFNNSHQPSIKIDYKEVEKDNESFHLFMVTDNGIGIAPNFQVQIFELFKRLHNRAESAGSGVGLAICKRAIDGLGGTIEIISQENQGSVFKIYLPVLAS